jgi:hypothetical protein
MPRKDTATTTTTATDVIAMMTDATAMTTAVTAMTIAATATMIATTTIVTVAEVAASADSPARSVL